MSNDKELFGNYYENWLRNTILYSNPDIIFADENDEIILGDEEV